MIRPHYYDLKRILVETINYILDNGPNAYLSNKEIKNSLDNYFRVSAEGEELDIDIDLSLEQVIEKWEEIDKKNPMPILLSIEDSKSLNCSQFELYEPVKYWIIIKVRQKTEDDFYTTYWKLKGIAVSYGNSEWYPTDMKQVERIEKPQRTKIVWETW